jgi:methionyl-tRNA formyltransferase
MRFVFFGSTEIATVTLQKLLAAGYIPNILVCNPDRPVGRKKILTPPETKQLILEKDLGDQVAILQPDKVSAIKRELTDLQPDFFVVAAYAKIIPPSVLAIPRLGTIGVHPSLLPKYRGASPIKSVLLAGERISGVTLYLLQAGIDDGPIFAAEELKIDPEDTNATLAPKLAELGGYMLVRLIPAFFTGTEVPKPQDHTQATFTRKFGSEDAFVPEEDLRQALLGNEPSGRRIHNLIRGFTPEPGAWTTKNGKRIKLLAARLREGKLELLTIQKEGKTPEPFRLNSF